VSAVKRTPRRLWYIGVAAAILTLILCAGVAILLRHPAANHPAVRAADITPVQPVLNPAAEQAALPPSQPEPVIGRFTADSPSIEPGHGVWLRWSVSNASGVTIEPGIGKVEPSGARFVHPAGGTTYSLLARGAGKPSEQRVTVEVVGTVPQPQPFIESFYAYPTTVERGQTATLHWQVSNATSVNIEPQGEVKSEGSLLVYPTSSQYYSLYARGPGGTNTASLMVHVTAPQAVTHPAVSVPQAQSEPVINSFTTEPKRIEPGQGAWLRWTVSNASLVTIEPGIGTVEASGSRFVPGTNTTYTLRATGHGYSEAHVTLEVAPAPQAQSEPVIHSFTASPARLNSNGGRATLSWYVDNATEVSIEPGIGTVEDVGHRDVVLGATTTYTLLAKGRRFSFSQRVTIEVTPAADLTAVMAQAKQKAASKDYSGAATLFRQAADGGNAEAMLSLGVLKLHGLGTSVDATEARQWFESAASRGNGVAMGNLGVIYEQGLGVTADRDEAMSWS
jgi:hypothetical protein